MVETALTKRALEIAKMYGENKIDECGKPILDRLLYVAEQMDDEVTTCVALLQDIEADSMIDLCNLLSEFPQIISDTVSLVRYDEYLYYDYLDNPYDVFIRGVMSNETAEKVVLEDLRYRIDMRNYAQLTMDLLHKIQMYKDAFMRINNHLSEINHNIKNAVKIDCCGVIVPLDNCYCPVCGKKIEQPGHEYLYYDFDADSICSPCDKCGVRNPAKNIYCGHCGNRLWVIIRGEKSVKIDDQFYREMISYLTDHEKEKAYYDSLRPGVDTLCRSPFDVIDEFNGESFENVMHEIIEALKESPYLNENCLNQYMIVDTLSHKEGYPKTAEIFRFLFDLSLGQVMSWPAYGILYDHFGEIMTDVLEAYVPCDLCDRTKVSEMYKTVYILLSDYILKELTPSLLHIYSGDENDDEIIGNVQGELEDDNGEDGDEEDCNIYEDYLSLECCVSHLDKADFKRHRDVSYIAAFGSDDLNTESTLIENMITYINKSDPKEAVTYQIIGSERFPSCKEMFDAIGTKPFGCTKRDAAQIAQAASFLGKFFDEPSMEMLVLKVRKLPYSIRRAEDIKQYSAITG